MTKAIDGLSYYRATLNDTTQYPQLKGEEIADVCVVGGGFTGVSTALNLSAKGYKVVLLESHTIGWGASGRNGGQLIRGLSGESALRKTHGAGVDELINRLCWRGNDIVKENVKKYNIDCDLKQGYMECAFKDRQMRDLEAAVEYYSTLGKGDHFRMISAQDMREYIGTDVYKGGMFNDLDGHLHPLNLCRGEAKAAAGLGAKIFENSPATGITHGKEPMVATQHGFVRAKMVVLAGNAYHLLEQKHIGGVVFPAGTYIIATEPLGDDLAKQVLPSDAAVCDVNEMLDYYRLSPDGRMLYGGQCNYSGRDPKDIKASILPRMCKVFPQLKNVQIDYQWGGMIGIVIKRVAHVGRFNDNIYYAQGYSGHGINQTHIVGEILSDAISGQMEDFDVFAKVKHWKIPAPRWVGNQMVAAGMLYYRLKDLL